MGTELEIQSAAPLPPASTRDNRLCVSHPTKPPAYRASGAGREMGFSLFPLCRHRLAPIIPQGQHTSGTSGTPRCLCESQRFVCLSWVCTARLLRSGARGQPHPRVAAADVWGGRWVPPSPVTAGSGELCSCLVLCQDWIFLGARGRTSPWLPKPTQPLTFPLFPSSRFDSPHSLSLSLSRSFACSNPPLVALFSSAPQTKLFPLTFTFPPLFSRCFGLCSSPAHPSCAPPGHGALPLPAWGASFALANCTHSKSAASADRNDPPRHHGGPKSPSAA